MQFEVWSLFLATVLLFMLTPGPSHILMLSNSVSNGFRKSIATAAGDLSANFLQMLAAALGLAGLLQQYKGYFEIVKWLGVAYLIYLGIKLFRTASPKVGQTIQHSGSALYWQGFITSASNPKAVIFFAALFPQFITAAEPLFAQFVVLCGTYLLIDGLFLCGYGKFANLIARKLDSSKGQHFNRVAGCLLIGVAVLLGSKGVADYV